MSYENSIREALETMQLNEAKGFEQGQTLYLKSKLTGKYEPVNYRGPAGKNQAVVLMQGIQMSVPMSDLTAKKPK